MNKGSKTPIYSLFLLTLFKVRGLIKYMQIFVLTCAVRIKSVANTYRLTLPGEEYRVTLIMDTVIVTTLSLLILTVTCY